MEEKYILCIPKNCGFNDTMCQIDEAYKFSKKTNRKLIIDTRLSCLADLLSNYMEILDPSDNIELDLTERNIKYLNNLSCYPKELTGKIDSIFDSFSEGKSSSIYQSNRAYKIFKPARIEYFINSQNYILELLKKTSIAKIFTTYYKNIRSLNLLILNSPFFINNEASVIIHHQYGGGEGSIQAIKLFKLKDDITKLMKNKLNTLGLDYDSIHIRNTDYKTNYVIFLQSIQSNLIGRKVLVCTDNYYVLESAREILKESEVISFNEYYNLNNDNQEVSPLHHCQKGLLQNEIFNKNLNVFIDLIGISKSINFYYTSLNKNRENTLISGFSKLGENLKNNKSLVDRWYGNI